MSKERKVVDYEVITQRGQGDLAREVMWALSDGWSLQGGAFYVERGYYAQTIVKYEDKEDIQ